MKSYKTLPGIQGGTVNFSKVQDGEEDLVLAIKARWARSLGLEDETMSIVDLEKATRAVKKWRKWALGVLRPDTVDGEPDDDFLRGWLAARLARAEGQVDTDAAEILSWLRVMGQAFPVEAAGAAFLADEYVKAAARADAEFQATISEKSHGNG